MGAVWLADDWRLCRPVAVKQLLIGAVGDEERLAARAACETRRG
jgi:hypothetical protein